MILAHVQNAAPSSIGSKSWMHRPSTVELVLDKLDKPLYTLF
jgi:hypothetical protein